MLYLTLVENFHFLRIYITDAFTGIRFPTRAQFYLFAAASVLGLGKPYRVENDFLQILFRCSF
jgi:hypothetical protein